MYVELTPADTIRDLHNLIKQAIPEFEFPRIDLYDYEEKIEVINETELSTEDFLLGVVWEELPEETTEPQKVMIDNSSFNFELTPEEINILAILMMVAWVQRQVTSIENTRMKFSGPDFKMTSQANHLSKLLALLAETQRQSRHMQRLYKRRRRETVDGNRTIYRSNWDVFGKGVLIREDFPRY